MNILMLIVIIDIVVGFGLFVWLLYRAYRRAKPSPAELSLQEHLVELESPKAAKKGKS